MRFLARILERFHGEEEVAMTAGTRVRHVEDGALGTVRGTTLAYTGHEVPLIRWDDRSSCRVGAVEIVDGKKGDA